MTDTTNKNVLSVAENQFNITIVSQEDNETYKEAYEYFREHFTNFVFEGGGMRGIAFGGSILYLEEHNLLNQMTKLAGSSAGAIVAAGLAVGYTGDEIIKLLHETNFEEFKDDSMGVIMDIWRFVSEYGVYKGEKFLEWISGVLEKKTGNANITFKEVYEQYGKELVLTGTCLNKYDTCYFHHETHPDMEVRMAVRISMSIPVFFKAVTLGDDVMVDGGLLNNYPIWVFDGKTIGDLHNVSEEDIKNSKTIGFKLMTDQEKEDYQLFHGEEKIKNLIDYFTCLINSMSIQIERGHIRTGYWDKTITIDTHNVNWLEFSLPLKTKEKLIQQGYNAVHEKIQNIQETKFS
jgi:NTE family protein